MAVDHTLRQPELGAALDAGFLEVQRRHNGNVPFQQQVERFVVHEGAMLKRVVTSPQSILDPLCRAAVSGHLKLVIVGGRHHRVHFVEGHAQRVMVVDIGGGGIAGGVRFDPFDTILDERSNRFAGVLLAVDDEDQPLHADLAEVGVPVHQAAGRADFAARGGQPRAGMRSCSIACLSHTSTLNRHPPDRAAVYPHSSNKRQFTEDKSDTYSTGYLMSRSSSAAMLKYVAWKCASTKPGRMVPPARRSAPRPVVSPGHPQSVRRK